MTGAGIVLDRKLQEHKLAFASWRTLTFFIDAQTKLEGWVNEDGDVVESWFTGEFDDKPIYAGRIPIGTKTKVIINGNGITGYKAIFDIEGLIEIAKTHCLITKV